MTPGRLYLEERIAIVRKALNEQTIRFAEKLPEDSQVEFNQFILDLIATLDGWDSSSV